MITEAAILSLQITAIYILFQEGMLLGWFRIMMANVFDKMFGKKASRYIQKPLWDCLPCMSGLWTIILTTKVEEANVRKIFLTTIINIPLILVVCGMAVLIDKFLDNEGIVRG